MKCPNCRNEIPEGNICPVCNVDAVLFKKVKTASARLYNKGLQLAKINDLSGAEKALAESITFNKKNFRSRNLLGLVYYEKGQVADALKQWIISSSLNKRDETAKGYIEALHDNPRQLENYNDAVKMYNQAIVYLCQKSDDLALIQLKKAVELNPKLVEAYNLLTFCHILCRNIPKAKECIDAVIALDVNNPIAINYAKELNYFKSRTEFAIDVSKGKIPKVKINKSIESINKKRSIIGKSEVISFIAGMLCTVAVLLVLIEPAFLDNKNQIISDLTNKSSSVSDELTKLKEETSAEITKLKDENQTLKDENEKYAEKETLRSKSDTINKAEDFLSDGDYNNAAVTISTITPEGLDDITVAKYESIKEQSYPVAAENLYTSAKGAFLEGRYSDAQPEFENVLLFSSGENFVDDTIYYLGKIAEENGEKDKAKSYFERIINEYPNSNQYPNAENSLNLLNEPANES
ncbi:MAG: tetratricopeptide repeat protein [Lachnospiraceae bacterium]|nr:tetratricopeptide repeat protein [Lachnospiraceae bacterium]